MKHHYLRWIKAILMAEGFDAPGPESRPLKLGRQVFDATARGQVWRKRTGRNSADNQSGAAICAFVIA